VFISYLDSILISYPYVEGHEMSSPSGLGLPYEKLIVSDHFVKLGLIGMILTFVGCWMF